MEAKQKFLTAEWRKLVMFNYEIDPILLQNYVPKHTEIDFFAGKTYISVVGFMFLNTKMLGLAIPFHRNFEEVNLRFYVRYKFENEWRRGVVFIREIVPLWAVANIANLVYNENYITLPMQHQIHENATLEVNYAWQFQKNNYQMAVEASPSPQTLVEGSEAEFITEHYWGYTQGKTNTIEYQVEHPRWDTYAIQKSSIKGDFKALYGNVMGEIIENNTPSSVLLAEGSEIIVRQARLIK